MLEDNTTRERILAFIDYKGLNKRRFLVACGMSETYIDSMGDGGLGPKAQKAIATAFPELNIAWLITGQGSMLREDYDPAKVQENERVRLSNAGRPKLSDADLSKEAYRQIIAEKDRLIEQLIMDKKQLYEIIERLSSRR